MTNEEEVLYDLTLTVKVTKVKLEYLIALGQELWAEEPLPEPTNVEIEDANNKRYINKALVQILNDGVDYRRALNEVIAGIPDEDEVLH